MLSIVRVPGSISRSRMMVWCKNKAYVMYGEMWHLKSVTSVQSVKRLLACSFLVLANIHGCWWLCVLLYLGQCGANTNDRSINQCPKWIVHPTAAPSISFLCQVLPTAAPNGRFLHQYIAFLIAWHSGKVVYSSRQSVIWKRESKCERFWR